MSSGRTSNDGTSSNYEVMCDHEFNTTKEKGALNELAANINRRLTSGLHGEFYEGGTGSQCATRHQQLPMLFEVKQQLEKLNGNLEKQEASKSRERKKRSKSELPADNPHENHADAENSESLELFRRDLSIYDQRLRQTTQKVDQRLGKLEGSSNATSQDLARLSKRRSEAEKAIEPLRNAIEQLKESTDLLSGLKTAQAKNDAVHSSIEELIQTSEKRYFEAQSESERLREQVAQLQESNGELRRCLRQLTGGVVAAKRTSGSDATIDTSDEESLEPLEQPSTSLRELATAIADLREDVGKQKRFRLKAQKDVDERLQALEQSSSSEKSSSTEQSSSEDDRRAKRKGKKLIHKAEPAKRDGKPSHKGKGKQRRDLQSTDSSQSDSGITSEGDSDSDSDIDSDRNVRRKGKGKVMRTGMRKGEARKRERSRSLRKKR